MPCNPGDNQINVDFPPPPSIPGFGIPFSPIQIPLPSFDLPLELVTDFLALIQQLTSLFPSGEFKPISDSAMRDFLEFLSNILSQISPFLSFYNFILALLNIIKCIIDIICAIPNPFAVANKVIVLFTQCLPPFLNLFPFLALILMIIALLLLILALIEYIILTILGIILAIIENITVFVDAVELQDSESILAAVQKIASLLCFLENILAVLVAIAAIINIIKSLATFGGVLFCSDEDEDGCCPTVLCPPFIKTTPDGITTEQGKLIYIPQVGLDLEQVFSGLGLDPAMLALISIPPIRKERWQVYDKNPDTIFKINSIYTPVIPLISEDIFWTDEVNMSKDTPKGRAQYTVDLTVNVNPAQFGIPDPLGTRKFRIKECIVVEKPYVGAYKYNSEEDPASFTTRDLSQGIFGVLSIAGGKVFEIDGYGEEVPYNVDGEQASLNNFIHKDPIGGTSVPSSDDSISFDNIEFTWKPNAPALAGYNLTTFGCIPEVAFERNVLNSVIAAEGLEPVDQKIPALPDLEETYKCCISAINIFRKSISPESAAVLQASLLTCLNKLKSEIINIVGEAVKAGASQYKSDFELDPDIQFVGNSIKVSAYIRDANGIILTNKIPEESAKMVIEKLNATVTLGEVSGFEYDGYSLFTANITSDLPGDGEVSVIFNGKVFSNYTPGSVGTQSTITEKVKNYTFIDINATGAGTTPVRRDETDVE